MNIQAKNTYTKRSHVSESRFGVWFLGTSTWETHVLNVAIQNLGDLIRNRRAGYPTIIDIGCGWGRSFKFLKSHFAPQRLIGADIDPAMLELTATEAAEHGLNVDLLCISCSDIAMPDASVDMVFCHQTFHHLVDQENALREFHRILKPDGVLLFAESTRPFIHSWIIRLLFRHPMDMQKSADEYIEMIKNAGFQVSPDSISYPYLWWSRKDLGVWERWFNRTPPQNREETLVNLVAVRC
ncbi:MAG: class I SAM-dependent methyltransferase [Rhodospirillales bacterium]